MKFSQGTANTDPKRTLAKNRTIVNEDDGMDVGVLQQRTMRVSTWGSQLQPTATTARNNQ